MAVTKPQPNHYEVGQLVELLMALTDQSGNPITPTTVAGFWNFNGGSPNAGNLNNPSAGNYNFTVDTSINGAGTYGVRWITTGTGQAAAEETFIVDPKLAGM